MISDDSVNTKAPSGKKAIKVYWYAKDGSELNFGGYEVYRSTNKNICYGTKPVFKTTGKRYFNTAIKKGTKYYYKVCAYKVIDGEKVYTDYSLRQSEPSGNRHEMEREILESQRFSKWEVLAYESCINHKKSYYLYSKNFLNLSWYSVLYFLSIS